MSYVHSPQNNTITVLVEVHSCAPWRKVVGIGCFYLNMCCEALLKTTVMELHPIKLPSKSHLCYVMSIQPI